MIIPNKITIGKSIYNVFNRYLFFRSHAGIINYFEKEIVLKRKYNKGRTGESTFFHEVSHGIVNELQYNYPKIIPLKDDEDFVQELGLLLRRVFMDLLAQQELPKDKKIVLKKMKFQEPKTKGRKK